MKLSASRSNGVSGISGVLPKHAGTATDQRDMDTLGRVQELRRNFKYVSVVAFGCTLIGTWEFTLGLIQFGLLDGGTAGMIWGYVACFVGFTCVYFSLAEMASIAPTAGGQYHWVSEFAPPRVQKYLSYLSGWLVFAGWQSGITAGCFLSGTIIQGLLVLNYPTSYVYERWHGTLLIMAIALFSVIFNTILARKLAFIEAILLGIYIVGFFAILIPLWVLAPRASARVFTDFNNEGGWSSTGTSVLIGVSGIIPSLSGFDCVAHIAEEVYDASRTVPKAIMSGVLINGIMGLIMIITLCFSLGNVQQILMSTTGFPFIQIFYNTTGSLAATNTLTAVILVVFASAGIGAIATSSRQLWAFARDGGFPFASTLAKVHRGTSVPLNAIIVSLVLVILISLINIGSSVALNAVVSLSNSSALASYILTVACVLMKRLRGPLPKSRWSLGRFGVPLNVASLVFMCPLFVFVFFPLFTPATPSSMNWGVVMFSSLILVSTVYYLIGGRARYTPPVMIVRRTAKDYDGKG